jgi:Tfp pilus assembly protein FimT
MRVGERCRAARHRRAFTLIEAAITLVLVGLVTIIALPSGAAAMVHSRVNKAAMVVASDLELSFSLAARQHRPLRVASSGSSYAIVGRADDTLQLRRLGANSDFAIGTVSFSSSTVDVFPTGLASGSLTVTLTRDGYTKTITMTRAGQVRVTP